MSYLKPYTVLWLTDIHHSRYKGHFSVMRKERSVPTMKSMQGESFIGKQYKKDSIDCLDFKSCSSWMGHGDSSLAALDPMCTRMPRHCKIRHCRIWTNWSICSIFRVFQILRLRSTSCLHLKVLLNWPDSLTVLELPHQNLGAEVEEELLHSSWSSTLLPHGSKRRKLLELTRRFLSSRTSHARTRSAALSCLTNIYIALHSTALCCFSSLCFALLQIIWSLLPQCSKLIFSWCSHTAWNHAHATSVIKLKHWQKKTGLRLLQACPVTLRWWSCFRWWIECWDSDNKMLH